MPIDRHCRIFPPCRCHANLARRVAAQSAFIGVATAEIYPSFSILGTIGWQASSFNDLFSSQANHGAIGPSFNWNLLSYGRIANNVHV